MPRQCPDCQQIYPDFVDFCVSDGCRLDIAVLYDEASQSPADDLGEPPDKSPSGAAKRERIPGRARLFPKVRGMTQPYAVEFFGDVVLGRFDPEVGPVDVDLSDVPESETISPHHARLSYADGEWRIEDLGADNGVSVNRQGPIDERLSLESGDEIALGNAIFVFEADQIEEADTRGEAQD